MELNKIFCEDCLETMKRIPENSIDLTLTSPPYDGLRDYKGYSFDFENIAKELFRITKNGGVVVWVVGDSVLEGSESGTSFKQTLFFKEIGFRIHDTMIYEKNGAAYPANEKSNRYTQIFEYMFVFSKGAPKTFNLIKDKKNRWGGSHSFGKTSQRNAKGDIEQRGTITVADFSIRNNIWKYNNGFGYTTKDESAYEHPAMFPEDLAADHIKSWSNENDLVYDPFMGSGTTAKIAMILNRNFLGSEISEEYVKIAEDRIKPFKSRLF